MVVTIKTLTGRSHDVHVSRGNTVADLKSKFQDVEGTHPDQQRLLFGGRQLEDDQTLEEYGIDAQSTIHLVLRVQSGSPITYYLDDSLMDPKFDDDFTNKRDDGTRYSRGGYLYQRPIGWKRYALKVLGRYKNDNWLAPRFWKFWSRRDSSPGEWPVSYHGTALHSDTNSGTTTSLAEDGYKLTKGKNIPYSRGIYSTPSIDIAAKYALTFEVDGKRYQMVFQNRVNPANLRMLSEHQAEGGQFWVSPEQDDVRPYAICVRQVDGTTNERQNCRLM